MQRNRTNRTQNTKKDTQRHKHRETIRNSHYTFIHLTRQKDPATLTWILDPGSAALSDHSYVPNRSLNQTSSKVDRPGDFLMFPFRVEVSDPSEVLGRE